VKRAECIERIRQNTIKQFSIPGAKEKRSQISKRIMADPKMRNKVGEASKQRFSNPEIKEKHIAGIRNYWATPESRMRASLTAISRNANPAVKKKQSDAAKKRTGDKNPSWKGGVSFVPYCPKFNREFKERVRAYFGYQCIECGEIQTTRNFVPHHVNYDKMVCCNNVKPLFVLLCQSCNSKSNGNKKVSRNDFQQYYTNIIESYYLGKCFFTQKEFNDFRGIP